MVTERTVDALRASGMSPLEVELALASFGPEGAPETAPAEAGALSRGRRAITAPTLRMPLSIPDPVLAANPHLAAWRARLNGLGKRNALARPLSACGRLTPRVR